MLHLPIRATVDDIPMDRVISDNRSATRRRDLRAIMADSVAFSLMVGIGETYLPAFALALGLGDVAAGLIATVPMMIGGILQLASPWAVHVLGSHRRWVVVCAALQAVSLALLLPFALTDEITGWLVFLPATLYWAAGLATGPAWNRWMDDIVPRPIRATFFATRVRVSQISVLLGLMLGGCLLRLSGSLRTAGEPVLIFAVLFGIAAASRGVSACLLASQSESFGHVAREGIKLVPTIQQLRGLHATRLVIFLMTMQVAVYVAGPYFTPYMLTQLKLSYAQYMVLLCCGVAGKALALPWAGMFAKRWGATRLLLLGAIGIVPVSALWLVSHSLLFLAVLQTCAGMVWAAYELAMFLLFFETIPRANRVGMLTLYNLGNSTAMVCGTLLGAAVISQLADNRTAYLVIFVSSAVARGLSLVLLPRKKITARF